MADTTRRDVEFVIRARDMGSRTFREVSSSVDGLTGSLEKQIAAATKGEISAGELRAAYRQLDQAGRALLSQQSLIDYYRKIGNSLEVAEAKAKSAREEQEKFAATLGEGESRTKKQEAALNRLTKASESAEKKAATLRAAVETQGEKLRAAGIETANLAASQAKLVAVADQVGDALTRTQSALDSYDTNLRRTRDAQRELADAKTLAEFRQVGTVAEQNARSLGVGADASDRASAAAQTTASRLRAIIDPARFAGENIDTLTAEVERLDGVIGKADQPIREYQDAIYELGEAQRNILGQAKGIDAYRTQEAAVEQARRATEQARAEVLRYAAAVQSAEEPNRDLASALRQAEATLSAENRELDRQNAKLEEMSRNMKRAGIDTRNLAAAEDRLEAASRKTTAALDRVNDAASGKNTRAGRFLGLRPYELTNLSYQINDIFTQIASGTSVTQTLAQQGGQIVQIFPRAFAALAAFIPEIAAGAAVVLTLGAAIKNISDEEASLRQFSGALALNADGALYNAQALADTAHELDVYAGSLEDARKSLSTFIGAGIAVDMLERFGKTAQNVAEVTGKDIPEAAAALATGFSGGWQQVKKLNDEFHFLSAAEAEQIRLMFDSGEAAEARTRAFEIFEGKADDAAEKSRGPWGDAAKALTRIWDNLLESIGESQPFQDAISWLDSLGNAVERWAKRVTDAKANIRESGTSQAGSFLGDLFLAGQPAGPYSNSTRDLLNSIGPASFFGGQIATPGNRNGFRSGADAETYITNRLAQSGYGVRFTSRGRTPEENARIPGSAANSYHTRNLAQGGAGRDFVLTLPGGRTPTQQDYDRVKEILQESGRFAEIVTRPHGTGAHAHVGYGITDANGQPTAQTQQQQQRDTINSQNQQALIAGREVLEKMREEIGIRDKSNHDLRLQVAEREARRRVQEAGGDKGSEDQAAALARADTQRKINEEVEKEAKEAAARTEAERRRIAALTDSLRSDLRGLETRAQRAQDASLQARLQAIDTQFSGIEQNIKEAEAGGVKTVDGLSIAQYRERVEAGKTVLKQQEQMAFYTDQVKKLEDQRAARLSEIADDSAAGLITTEEAFRQALAVNNELAPQIAKMAGDAITFATALRGAEPNPALEAYLAAMTRTQGRENRPSGGTNTPVAGAGRQQLTEGQSELNALIQQRNELVANYARLVELGTLSQQEAQEKTRAAYEQSSPLIQEQIGELLRLIDALRAAGVITVAEFDRLKTSLEVTSEEAQYVDVNFQKLRTSIEDGLVNGATTALKGVAEAMAGLLDGTMDLGDAFDTIWDAARTGLADFLQGIADVLMQIAVMQAIQGLPFLDGMTGGLMDAAGLTAASTTMSAAATTLTAAGTTVTGGATAVAGAAATLGTTAGSLAASGGTLAASAAPLLAAATALSGAAAAMASAASLQLAANATGGIFHSGGIVGSTSSGVSRSMSSLAWVGAPRHHDGAVIGMASNERAAILEVGEEVLKKNDPRNILNGGAAAGGRGGAMPPIVVQPKIVNAIDSGQFVSEGMATKEGETAVLNFIGKRKSQIRRALGVD